MSASKLLKKRGARVQVKKASQEQVASRVDKAKSAKKRRARRRATLRGPSVFRLKNSRRRATQLGYNDLLTAESALGRTLFGPVPAGHRREFFTPRKNVWLWYESWTDAAGVWHDMMIRYEVRPAGVYKLPAGGIYTRLTGAELDNFATAVRGYAKLVKSKLYS